MKVREMIRLLIEDGWVHVAQTGSHRQFRHPTKPGKVTVPRQRVGRVRDGHVQEHSAAIGIGGLTWRLKSHLRRIPSTTGSNWQASSRLNRGSNVPNNTNRDHSVATNCLIVRHRQPSSLRTTYDHTPLAFATRTGLRWPSRRRRPCMNCINGLVRSISPRSRTKTATRNSAVSAPCDRIIQPT